MKGLSVTVLLGLLLLGLCVAGEEPAPPPPPDERPADPVELPDLPGLNLPGVVPPWSKGPSSPPVASDQIQLSTVQERPVWGEAVEFTLRGADHLPKDTEGHCLLRDELGRVIFSEVLPANAFTLDAAGTRRFTLPAFQPVTAVHTLDLMLNTKASGHISRVCNFVLRRPPTWDHWWTLLHAPYANGHWPVLHTVGIDGGMAYRLNETRRAALYAADVPFYVENVARSFLSRYRSERGLWERTVARALEDPAGTGALIREPSLWDRHAAEAYVREIQRHARAYRPDHPLFYSLAAEPSVTCLSAAFDFDFHPDAIAEYRRWLERDAFGTLNALNAAWGTQHTSWDEIQPMRTGEALARVEAGQWAFGPWLSFRTFQDESLARALREGGRILRETDPEARVGATGLLGPFAFGGWDWTRLADALDVCEAYEIGGARQLWRDLAPGKPAIATVPLSSDPQSLPDNLRALWSTALDSGPRGVLLWDEQPVEGSSQRLLLTSGGEPSPVAVALGPTLRELAGPMGTLLAHSRRAPVTIGLLYSPASVRVHWLLEASRLHPKDWQKAWGANTAAERYESVQLRLRMSWMALLGDLGLPWRFVSSTELERGRLDPASSGPRVLVLPRAIALSNIEVVELKNFVAHGGILIADALCGRFNDQGLARATPALDDLFGVATAREPFAPEPPHPLETIRNVSDPGSDPLLAEDLRIALPPPFSDKTEWINQPPPVRSEYHRSPVLALRRHGEGSTLYLNLNLEDYLNWRLHPDNPRAAMLQRGLRALALAPLYEAQNEDLQASNLPPGTEVVRFSLSNKGSGTRLLALRRLPQTRLHELALEGDSNAAFDQAAPFKLVWKKPVWVSDPRQGESPGQRTEWSGTLDPVTPTFITVLDDAPPPIEVALPGPVQQGQKAVARIRQGEGGRLFVVTVKGPDNLDRSCYGGTHWAENGSLEFTIPFAVSDLPGEWTLSVREWCTAVCAQATLNVEEKK